MFECFKLKRTLYQNGVYSVSVLRVYAHGYVLVRCKICGHKWYTTPSKLLRAQLCQKCCK